MKKVNLVFAVLTLILFVFGAYLNNYADGGADGLNNFFALVIVLILSIGCLIGFFVSLFLRRDTSQSRKILLTIIALFVCIGFLASIGLFGYHTTRYEVEVQEKIE